MARYLLILLLLVNSQFALADTFSEKLVVAATERTKHIVVYDGSYQSIPYPGGDVPKHLGVCTDVVIRSYRAVGVDLQVLVHEDMKNHFSAYPSKRIWGLSSTDSNIDHRRVPNLQTFFSRHGKKLIVGTNPEIYQPGDLVTWMLPGNLPHIGIVSDQYSKDSKTPLIIHNIGLGPRMENMLFKYVITGHYRYEPKI